MSDLTQAELEAADEAALRDMGLSVVDPLQTTELQITAQASEQPTRTSDGSWIQEAEYECGLGGGGYEHDYL